MGEIDAAATRLTGQLHPRLGGTVWKRAEDETHGVELCVLRSHVRQGGVTKAHGRPALLVRGSERERERRMAQDGATKLAPSVAARAEHAHVNSVHTRMHNNADGARQPFLAVAVPCGVSPSDSREG